MEGQFSKRIMSHSIFVSLSCFGHRNLHGTVVVPNFYFKFVVAIEFNLIKPYEISSNKTYVELDNKNVLVRFAILLAYLVVNSRHKIESIKYYAFIIFP